MRVVDVFLQTRQDGAAVKRFYIRLLKNNRSKQTTFVERGFALGPPEGGTLSGPS